MLGVYVCTVRVKQESAKLAGGLGRSRTEAFGKPPKQRDDVRWQAHSFFHTLEESQTTFLHLDDHLHWQWGLNRKSLSDGEWFHDGLNRLAQGGFSRQQSLVMDRSQV